MRTEQHDKAPSELDPESVWLYPRPAVCEPCAAWLHVINDNVIIAETRECYRTLETSHPPTYYFPPGDTNLKYLEENNHHTFCEWKGVATYFDLVVNGKRRRNVAWTYRNPSPSFAPIKDYVSFYASKVDACFVNEERVIAQPGNFYGGWITSNLKGPFKGEPGTSNW